MRFRFADCIVDSGRFELWRGGRVVPVQPKVLELLIHLLENRERAVRKQELLDALWGGVAVGETSLTRAVSMARAALGERERDAAVIRTVRGRGYRIGVPVVLEATPAAPAPAATEEPPEGALRLLCRDAELAIGLEALEAALAAHGQVVLITGEPGIGKSRLAAELAARASARGARVLWGRCHEGEDRPGYWPWQQVLRAGLESWGLDAVRAGLGSALPDVAEILPELREQLPDLPRPAPGDEARARFRLCDGVVRLLRARAREEPIALVLDDLHGADGPSLALLRFLSHELDGTRIFAVATYRHLEVESELQAMLADLARTQRPRNRILLRGLTPACVRRFIHAVLGAEPSEPVVELCFRRSEGNPLFLLELIQWLESRPSDPAAPSADDEIPEGIRQVIGRRLALLGQPCLRALEAAAVVGADFPLGVAARAADLPEEELLALLARAERARVVARVRGRPGHFRFSHVLVSDVLVEGLDAERRALLHRRAGEALEAIHLPHPIARTDLDVQIPGPALAALARHFSEGAPAGDVRKALDYCARAGACAAGMHAHAEAAQHFARALSHLALVPDRDGAGYRGLALGLADAEFRAGRAEQAGAALAAAVGEARARGDAVLLAEAAVRVSQFKVGGNVLALEPARVALLEEARARLDPGDSALRARVLAALGEELFWGDEPDRADALVDEGIAMARRLGDPATLSDALVTKRLYRLDPRARDERGAVADELVRISRQTGNLAREIVARLDFRLCELAEIGDAPGYERELELCARLAGEARQPALHWMVARARALPLLWRGQLTEAAAAIDAARAIGEGAAHDQAILSHRSAVLSLRRLQGRFAELEGELAREGRLPRERGHKQSALALLYAETGRADLARRALDELCDASFAGLRRDSNYAYNLALLCEVCVALGDARRIEALSERLLPFAGRHLAIQTIVTAGCASRFLGLAAGELGDLAAAEGHFEAAIAMEQQMGAAPFEALARRDFAALLERRGRRAAAREQRDAAVDLARPLGIAGF
jgi:DNA-binding winged helix-turn-helix (wHTH) protein/tetratricopeptide (TPR) repeat protein